MIRSTASRCCSTSASEKLAQNPFGPIGQFSGSARKNKNTASSRNVSGQIFAQEKYRLRESSASMPIRNTTRPAQLWLYSDQAISAGVFVPNPESPGTNAAGKVLPFATAAFTSSFDEGEMSFKSGLENLGMRGENRSAISDIVTRS